MDAIFSGYGGVAQQVRACGSYPQCPGFKSLHRHQHLLILPHNPAAVYVGSGLEMTAHHWLFLKSVFRPYCVNSQSPPIALLATEALLFQDLTRKLIPGSRAMLRYDPATAANKTGIARKYIHRASGASNQGCCSAQGEPTRRRAETATGR